MAVCSDQKPTLFSVMASKCLFSSYTPLQDTFWGWVFWFVCFVLFFDFIFFFLLLLLLLLSNPKDTIPSLILKFSSWLGNFPV